MTPLLTGVLASQISGHLTPPWAGPEGAYDALASTTLSSPTASITFNGIPSGYKHLQVRFIANINAIAGANFRLNGDTTTSYRNHWLIGDGAGSASYAGGASDATYGSVYGQGYNGGSFTYAAGTLDIMDYNNINKPKAIRAYIGIDRNGTGAIQLVSGFWNNLNPVTSITFLAEGSTNLAANTSVAIYGVK